MLSNPLLDDLPPSPPPFILPEIILDLPSGTGESGSVSGSIENSGPPMETEAPAQAQNEADTHDGENHAENPLPMDDEPDIEPAYYNPLMD